MTARKSTAENVASLTDAELDDALKLSHQRMDKLWATQEKKFKVHQKAEADFKRAWGAYFSASEKHQPLFNEYMRRYEASREAEASRRTETIRQSTAIPVFALALGLTNWPATKEQIVAAWRQQARTHHPDAGGTDEQFAAARNAYEQAIKAIGGQP